MEILSLCTSKRIFESTGMVVFELAIVSAWERYLTSFFFAIVHFMVVFLLYTDSIYNNIVVLVDALKLCITCQSFI